MSYEKCPRRDCGAEWHGLPKDWNGLRCPGSCQEGPMGVVPGMEWKLVTLREFDLIASANLVREGGVSEPLFS